MKIQSKVNWVSELFVNGTSAQYGLYKAIQLKAWEEALDRLQFTVFIAISPGCQFKFRFILARPVKFWRIFGVPQCRYILYMYTLFDNEMFHTTSQSLRSWSNCFGLITSRNIEVYRCQVSFSSKFVHLYIGIDFLLVQSGSRKTLGALGRTMWP